MRASSLSNPILATGQGICCFRHTPGQALFTDLGLNGGPVGTFTTTYKFEAKFAPDGSEIHGRCQHPIVDGSGTGGFEGASGRLNFKDIVETGEYLYKGHIDVDRPSLSAGQ